MQVVGKFFLVLILGLVGVNPSLNAQDDDSKKADQKRPDLSKIEKKLGNLVPLNKKKTIWIEPMKKIVVASGMICLTEGQLEMFACTHGTKEHESIITLHCKAFEIHTGLLAIGAKPGKPVVWDPKYVSASGDEIEIDVHWLDKKGNPQKADAKEWIRNTKTKKKMTEPWVFAGSSFYKDERTGEKFYMAEGGEVVCLSNFSTAMLDINVESSAVNAGLLFEAFHKKIPPLKTHVRLVFKIKTKDKNAKKGSPKKSDSPDKKAAKKDSKSRTDREK